MERFTRSPQLCRYYNIRDGCRRANCQFSHPPLYNSQRTQHDESRQNISKYDYGDGYFEEPTPNPQANLPDVTDQGRTQLRAPDGAKHCELHGYNASHNSNTCRVLGRDKLSNRYADQEQRLDTQTGSQNHNTRDTLHTCINCGQIKPLNEPCSHCRNGGGHNSHTQGTPPAKGMVFSSPTKESVSRQLQQALASVAPLFANGARSRSNAVSSPSSQEPFLTTASLERASARIGADVRNFTYCAMCLIPLDPTIPAQDQRHKTFECNTFYKRVASGLPATWQDSCAFFGKDKPLPYCRQCGEFGMVCDADMDVLMHGINTDQGDGHWLTAAGRLVVIILCGCSGDARSKKKSYRVVTKDEKELLPTISERD